MIPVLKNPRAFLFNGDSASLGTVLKPDTIDAIVCDPPAGISFMGKGWDDDKGGRDVWIKWLVATLAPAFAALKPGGHALVWALPRTSHWTATALEDLGFEVRDVVMHVFLSGFPKSLDVSKAVDQRLGAERQVVGERHVTREIKRDTAADPVFGAKESHGTMIPVTAPATPEAAQWEGWGTALKPAAEHWILCRKPFAKGGTVAANVLAHGTGALNIDACRIGMMTAAEVARSGMSTGTPGYEGGHGKVSWAAGREPQGRWPAHVAIDADVPAEGFDHARYFYAPKGSRAEKDLGCEHLPIKSGGEATDRKDGSAGLDNPRAGAGRTGGARNHHPTVKSQALMRWLCKLITPSGGVVLDPFTGSGSTAVAALSEGFKFVGCEMDPEYAKIAVARITHALKEQS